MKLKERWNVLGRSPVYRTVVFLVGCLFILATPIAGPIPGPGGTIVFAIGLGLILRSSLWAKKRYVHFKRKQPKIGYWTDWGLRRKSAKRRIERAKRNEKAGN